MAFIRRLEAGHELTLEINNPERNHFAILELSGDQRHWARAGDGDGDDGEHGDDDQPEDQPDDGDVLPDGARGFSGQVRGVVVSKGDHDTFGFKVARVLNVWKNNKAEDPESIAGHTVRVSPRRQKIRGKWHKVESHVAFIRKLRTGQELSLEIKHVEGPRDCQILELSRKQRGWARRKGREGPTDEDPEKALRKELRELRAELRELRAEIKRLKAENAELRKRLERREKEDR